MCAHAQFIDFHYNGSVANYLMSGVVTLCVIYISNFLPQSPCSPLVPALWLTGCHGSKI